MYWIIAIIGIVLNYVLIVRMAKNEPNGAMGMGLFFIIALVPYLIAGLYVIHLLFGSDPE